MLVGLKLIMVNSTNLPSLHLRGGLPHRVPGGRLPVRLPGPPAEHDAGLRPHGPRLPRHQPRPRLGAAAARQAAHRPQLRQQPRGLADIRQRDLRAERARRGERAHHGLLHLGLLPQHAGRGRAALEDSCSCFCGHPISLFRPPRILQGWYLVNLSQLWRTVLIY